PCSSRGSFSSGAQPGHREAKQLLDAPRVPPAPQIHWEPMGCTMAPSSPARPGPRSSSSFSRRCSARPAASCRSRWGSTGVSLGVPPPPGAGTAPGDPLLRPPARRPCSLPLLPGVLKSPAARARHVTFEDEVVASGKPTGSIPSAKGREKPGASSVPPGLAPRPHALPDYVVRYPAIRSSQQREGYKGVFQDQLWEYTELLREIHSTLRRELEAGSTSTAPAARWKKVNRGRDWAFLAKQQRCEYLKQKLTHIKARIQEYDRDCAGTF
uniref:OCEL domain-containing protein n=1 Tax=Strigops habroptila TaxID=2489341 RepID=A0A672UT76_STRHB